VLLVLLLLLLYPLLLLLLSPAHLEVAGQPGALLRPLPDKRLLVLRRVKGHTVGEHTLLVNLGQPGVQQQGTAVGDT
jgi:hypothetical protein